MRKDLLLGDAIEQMSAMDDNSVDMVLCDPPYGKTKNRWDTVIDMDLLWLQLFRVSKDDAAIVLFGIDKFTAQMMLSQPKYHRYNLIWDKCLSSGFLNANRMPLRRHEDIMVFYRSLPTYNPQKTIGEPSHSKGRPKENENNNYGEYGFVDNSGSVEKHPTSILSFQKTHPSKMMHPTEKPVDLLRWLVRTYTNEGDIVLDPTCGSGSTLVAASLEGRGFIGIDNEEPYIEVSRQRLLLESGCTV